MLFDLSWPAVLVSALALGVLSCARKGFRWAPRRVLPVEPRKDLQLPGHWQDILDAARWAPSGDNEQPWRFEIIDATHVRVRSQHTPSIYDMDGFCQQIALGAMMENLVIAASQFGYRVEYKRDPKLDTSHLQNQPTKSVWDVKLIEDASVKPSPLNSSIRTRATHRHHMKMTKLTPEQKAALEKSVGEEFAVGFIDSFSEKLKVASLTFRVSCIRLSMPESMEVHKNMLEWVNPFPETKLPAESLCLDNTSISIMRWAMDGGWERMQMLNKYAGPGPSSFQMDYLPALACGAHAILRAKKDPKTSSDFFECGRAFQRFWLTVDALGLYMQPEAIPLVFARYVRNRTFFTTEKPAQAAVVGLADEVGKLIEARDPNTFPFFFARVGHGNPVQSRSIRMPLEKLLL